MDNMIPLTIRTIVTKSSAKTRVRSSVFSTGRLLYCHIKFLPSSVVTVISDHGHHKSHCFVSFSTRSSLRSPFQVMIISFYIQYNGLLNSCKILIFHYNLCVFCMDKIRVQVIPSKENPCTPIFHFPLCILKAIMEYFFLPDRLPPLLWFPILHLSAIHVHPR